MIYTKNSTTFADRIIHGDCISVLRSFPSESIDLVVTDPPYIVDYMSRDGRTIFGDNNASWIKPAFREVHRVLKPDSFCISFYGWNKVERFMYAWKDVGLRPVGHFVWAKDYASSEGFTKANHECAYLLVKGNPTSPPTPPRPVKNSGLLPRPTAA